MDLKQISVTILAKDSQLYIREVLQSVAPFGEVLLYDTGSRDQTIEIAQTFENVRIVQAEFIGFGPTHNMASAAAKYDWILSIDSDEIVTAKMVDEIAKVEVNIQTVYAFPRQNYFNGKFIKWCGWYPDKQNRLYNRTATRFSDAQVHEAIITTGMHKHTLNGVLLFRPSGCFSMCLL